MVYKKQFSVLITEKMGMPRLAPFAAACCPNEEMIHS